MLVQTAMTAAAKVNTTAPLTLAREAGRTINATTGAASGSALNQVVPRAIALTERELRGRTASWVEAVVAVMVAANDLEWVPAFGDVATFLGRKGKVTDIKVLSVGANVVAYELAIGA